MHGASSSGELQLRFDEALTNRIRELVRRARVTLNTCFQGAWGLTLSHLTGSDDIVFGMTVSGRPADLPGVEKVIGNLINTAPLRVAVPRKANVRAYLENIFARNARIRSFEHISLPGMWRASDGGVLFNTILAFQNFPNARVEFSKALDVHVSNFSNFDRNHYPVSLAVIPEPTSVALKVTYDASEFGPEWISRALAAVELCCREMADSLDGKLQDVLQVLKNRDREFSGSLHANAQERQRFRLTHSKRTPLTK